MYITVCIKDSKQFKRGELYDTYQETGGGCFVSKKGSNDEYTNLPFLEYKDYFKQVRDYCFIPKENEEEVKWGFLFSKSRINKFTGEVHYAFNTDYDTLVKLNLEIFHELNKIKIIDEQVVINETIHKLMDKIVIKSKYNTYEQLGNLIVEIKKQINEEMINAKLKQEKLLVKM